MGKRGPKKTPTTILKLRGSNTVYTRNKNEPEVEPSLPPCPDWLKQPARDYWGEIGAYLEGLGVMGEPHTPALALLCDAMADFLKFRDEAAVAPSFCESANGSLYQHPVHSLKSKAWTRVMQGLREFGMTPSALSNVTKDTDSKKPQGGLNYTLGKTG